VLAIIPEIEATPEESVTRKEELVLSGVAARTGGRGE
jgi:hypothetical protein